MNKRILIVDDDPSMVNLLEKQLTVGGYEVLSARNGAEAMHILLAEGPPIVITDWMMPAMDGLELCRAIRSSEGIGLVYIIMLTSHTDKARISKAFEAGADDFLSKPPHRGELLARLSAGERIIRFQEELARQNRALHRANAEMAVLNQKLQRMATIDPLTGLANRAEAMARLNQHWATAVRHNQPLACIVLDIDHFKRFNDTYGHNVGDVVLHETAKTLDCFTRAGETACRVGGEEFLVLCPDATARMAAVAAERLRQAIESNRISCNGLELAITVSAGVAERCQTCRTPDDLLKHADDALYAAKRAGRNRVRTAGDDQVAGAPNPLYEPPEGNATVAVAAAGPSEPPVKVLVADDDANSRRLCKKLLQQAGYDVIEAVDGLDVAATTRRAAPEVIIMATATPHTGALKCTRRLKADPATRDIPIIVAAALTEEQDIIAGLEAGVDEYVARPIREKELALRVKTMARLYRSRLALVRSNEVRGEQARALTLLLEFSQSLVAAQSVASVLEKAVSTAAELTCCRRVSIMLPDDENQFLTIAKAIGIDEPTAAGVRVPMGGAIAGRVFQSGEPVVINAPPEGRGQSHRHDSRFFVSVPLASMPLSSSERVLGVLNITQRRDGRPFEPHELECVDVICNAAASAIDDLVTRRARDEARDSIVVALAKLAEHRDTDTGKHLERVTCFSRIIAGTLRAADQFSSQIDEAFLRDLERAMPLHDVGKVAIPDHVLLKPGKLTPDEMDQARRHAQIGAETIRSVIKRAAGVSFLKMAEEIAWAHHEWYDGSGYPRGIKGQDIPLSARIAAVADVYDALTTRRVYKSAMPHAKAVAIIREGAGSQFDPAVVQAFLERESEFASVAAQLADNSGADEPAEAALAPQEPWSPGAFIRHPRYAC